MNVFSQHSCIPFDLDYKQWSIMSRLINASTKSDKYYAKMPPRDWHNYPS